MVGHRRLAPELEVRMSVGTALAPAPPDAGALLGDADEDAAEASLAGGGLEVGTGDLLLRLAAAKADERDRVAGGEALDRRLVAAADLAQERRRGDGRAAVEQEADEQAVAHQFVHVRLQVDAVDRAHLEGDAV